MEIQDPRELAIRFIEAMNSRMGANSDWSFADMTKMEQQTYDLAMAVLNDEFQRTHSST